MLRIPQIPQDLTFKAHDGLNAAFMEPFFCDSPKVVTSSAKLKRLRSPPDKCCKRAVNVCTLMSNCGRKLEIRIICVRSIATLLTTTSPVKLPRKRCDIAANNVVLPAPLQPNTATKSPVFI
uniref:Uncharacterized protein n=1 Tax=Glossina palpalis gambiensis TaxID=67801 RepID=A0A1B0AMC0_9MUSC